MPSFDPFQITNIQVVVALSIMMCALVLLLIVNKRKNMLEQAILRDELQKYQKIKHQLELTIAASSNVEVEKNKLQDHLEITQNRLSKQMSVIAELKERLRFEQQISHQKIELLEKAEQNFKDTFESLSRQTLKDNNRAFLDLAIKEIENVQQKTTHDLDKRQQSIENLFSPVQKSLTDMDKILLNMHENRLKAENSLSYELGSMRDDQAKLITETSNLAKALRQPHVRGRWGEVQLRRVVELAGMQNHCDFFEQSSFSTDNGMARPDMLIQMPENRYVVIDAKTPLSAYLDSIEADKDEDRQDFIKKHAAQFKTHIRQLSSKKYWRYLSNIKGTNPEFVVMFIPGEVFFSAALESDPELLEYAATKHIIIATPSTLIALLKTVDISWHQLKINENAQLISHHGSELYHRIKTLLNHWNSLGKHLNNAGNAFNDASSTLQKRVLVSARKLHELQESSQDELAELTEVNEIVGLKHSDSIEKS